MLYPRVQGSLRTSLPLLAFSLALIGSEPARAQGGPGVLPESLYAQRGLTEHLPNVNGFVPRAMRDLNGDGRADVFDEELAGVALAESSGRFQPPSALPFTRLQSAGVVRLSDRLVVTDLDEVPGTDIAVCSPNGLFVAFADRSGGYLTVQRIDPQSLLSLIAVDFNRNGDSDLVAVANRAPTVEVQLFDNIGNGDFAPPQVLATLGSQSLPVLRTIDFDGDIFPDLYVAVERSLAIVVRGTSSGLQVVDLSSILPDNAEIAPADFDGDGDDDFLSVAPNGVLLHENLGGSLSAGRVVAPPQSPLVALGVGDFDGDGNPDLVTCRDGILSLLPGRGDLTFGTPSAFAQLKFGSSFPRGVIDSGDADGDGIDDLLIDGPQGAQLYFGRSGTLPVTGDVPFFETIWRAARTTVGLAEVDQDGRTDFFVFQETFGTVSRVGLSVAQTAGRRTATAFPGFAPEGVPGTKPFAIEDLDGDGTTEALSFFGNPTELRVLRTQPISVEIYPLFRTALGGGTIDVDADGDRDILIPTVGGPVIWFETRPGQPLVERSVSIPGFQFELFTRLLALDLDSDGDEDFVQVASSGSPALNVSSWRNDGGGSFTFLRTVTVPPGPNFGGGPPDGILGDFDNDGDLDLWISGFNELLENDGLGNLTMANLIFNGERPAKSVPVDHDLDGEIELIGTRPTAGLVTGHTLGVWERTLAGYELTQASRASRIEFDLRPLDLDRDGDLDLSLPAPILNRAVDLHTPFLAQVGLDFPVEMRLAAGGPSLARFGALGIAAARPSRPIRTPLGDFDLLDPSFLPYQVLPNNGDPITIDLRVPNQSALVGAEFFLQASFVHVGPSLQLRFFSSAVLREEVAR